MWRSGSSHHVEPCGLWTGLTDGQGRDLDDVSAGVVGVHRTPPCLHHKATELQSHHAWGRVHPQECTDPESQRRKDPVRLADMSEGVHSGAAW